MPPTVVHRAGRDYPAACEARSDVRVVIEPSAQAVDPELAAAGEAQLARVRARAPWMYDGDVYALHCIRSGEVRLRPARYFDRVRTADALRVDPGLRARAVALAGGDPLHDGTGRAASIGVTTVATVRLGDVRALVVGRRAADMPMGHGEWHVVPSGMLEPAADGGDPVRATWEAELREELGVEPPPAGFAVLGLGWDLGRLVPEVCLTCELDVAAEELDAAVSREHGALAFVPLTRDGLAAFWAAHPPELLTPPGVAAIALFEERGGLGT